MTRRSPTPSIGPRRLRNILALGLSAAAFGGLIYIETVAAQDDEVLAEDWDDESDFDAGPIAEAEVAPTPAAVRPAPAAGTTIPTEPENPSGAAMPTTTEDTPVVLAHAGAAMPPAAMPVAAPPPAAVMVAMPDVTDMKVPQARRALKAAGLRMTVRDEFNDKVDRDLQRYYKVKKQRVEAGTEVEVGSWVRVQARERIVLAQGY